MFVGSKFCEHCGAIAASVEISLEHEAGDCPRCHKQLAEMKIGETKFLGCESCDGLWLDVTTFENICADREKQAAVLGFLNERTARSPMMTKVNYVPCPDCGELMNRNNFARASGVIVDMCKQHGVWFDAEELPRIVEFIQKGGMELSRQREKNELEDERRRLQNDALFSGGNIGDNSGIRNFVRSLFD